MLCFTSKKKNKPASARRSRFSALTGLILCVFSVSPFSFQRLHSKESELSLLGDDFDEKVENEDLLAVYCLPVSKISRHCGSYMR